MRKQPAFLALALLLCLSGCGTRAAEDPADLCRVVLEEGEGFSAQTYAQTCVPGETLRFVLEEQEGYRIENADYDGAVLTRGQNEILLELPEVRYTETVRLAVRKSGVIFSYFANGGTRLDGGGEDPVDIPVNPTHLRLNTALGTDLFSRTGHTLTGWNTEPDGSGVSVGLGSRVDPEKGCSLYAQWSRWTEEDRFRWEPAGEGAAITGYTGTEDSITVPAYLDGRPVQCIRAGAFAGAKCDAVILPETLQTVEDGAFSNCALRSLWMFDNLQKISDYAFSGCESLQTLHLSAAEAPCYSGTYYATFPDKLDRLISLKDQRKIVLFSGSSTRFGYDSSLLDAAFPDYEVVNMGVFAYTNALPQLEIIRACMKQEDILIHSPEFDAAQRQFCAGNNLDAPFFYMVEGNYDALAMLDLRNYGQAFTALHTYLVSKEDMTPRSYGLSPADFDEDGNPAAEPSYNEYGDYILYRPNADSEAPVYGLPVRYAPEAIPEKAFIDPLNRVYQTFLDRGVRVYFTYAPRNRLAVSEDTTPQTIAALDRHLREHLIVPVITEIQDSLVSGTYLYGTDNHLSTEGAAIRTQQIIEALRKQQEEENG